jgi:HAD superfamily hydrolase (TIGR01549 family)
MSRRPKAEQALSTLWAKASTIIFDVEGALVDAVPLTLACWQETLAHFGYSVPRSVLQCLSGMDGHDMLCRIEATLTRKKREEIIEAQGDRFKENYLTQVKPFGQALSLLRRIKDAGRTIGIATDCSRSELDFYLRAARVKKLIDRIACGDDAPHGKPHADLIKLALQGLAAEPSATVMVGDTPSDADAARKAGVPAVGVLTGGFRRCDLRAAGYRGVFKDLAELRQAMESS